jgi:beta-glucosidase/6-phospho-beta-glucosidase/beta-galactosidase
MGFLKARAELERIVEPESFVWATGIEDTFVCESHNRTGRALDEYELVEHYERLAEDIALIGRLGVRAARYGLPWYRLAPQKGRWDWSFADRAMDELSANGIEAILDLVHYGTPEWMSESFLNKDFPQYMSEFGCTVVNRYKDRIRWVTPLNEPRITAHYCGKVGHWPPYRRGWRGFASVLLQVAKGIVLTELALRAAQEQLVFCHVDATDYYEPTEPDHEEEATFRQRLVFLALDLITGKVDDSHPLWLWLQSQGIDSADLEWFLSNNLEPDVLGINLYPMFSHKRSQNVRGSVRFRMPYDASDSLLTRFATDYWTRYGRPIMITETASSGSVKRRQDWLNRSIRACFELRSQGVPVVGYTWWPMFALVAWSYRSSAKAIDRHLIQMGLWDLDVCLNRKETPLVSSYRAYAEHSTPEIGTGFRRELNV